MPGSHLVGYQETFVRTEVLCTKAGTDMHKYIHTDRYLR